MKPLRSKTLLIASLLAILAGCRRPDGATETRGQPSRILGPTAAGTFYPQDKAELADSVDRLLAAAKRERIENLRGLICPLSDYAHSGAVAAAAYKQLAGRRFATVIVLGPSHTAELRAGVVADADAVETPLGRIPVSPKAARLAAINPFSLHSKSEVHRPAWLRSAPGHLPPPGEDTPLSWEHSVQVQYPFLQRTLADFSVVPALVGDLDPEEAAAALLKVLDDDTLLVACSDLTHDIPYGLARRLDKMSTAAMCVPSTAWLETEQDKWTAAIGVSLAGGIKPVLTLLYLAQQKGWRAKLLEYRHSSDVQGLDQQPGVGYAAIAFYAPATAAADVPAAATGNPPALTAAAGQRLLALARRQVAATALGQELPESAAADAAEEFGQAGACFVTLEKRGQVRGRGGNLFPREPLCAALLHAARSAALEDARGGPVKPAEVADLHIELCVLGMPRRLRGKSPGELLAQLRPGIDGVMLRVEGRQGVLLPQDWRNLRQREQFLERLAAIELGVPASAWRRPDARILAFQVAAFAERRR